MRERLDSLKRLFYTAARLGVLGSVMLSAQVASAESVDGVQLPDGTKKVGERRFRSGQPFDKTLDYFRTIYPPSKYPRTSIVNQPGVRAVHISFPDGKKHAGLNVYEDRSQRREVRIYMVPAGRKSAEVADRKPKS